MSCLLQLHSPWTGHLTTEQHKSLKDTRVSLLMPHLPLLSRSWNHDYYSLLTGQSNIAVSLPKSLLQSLWTNTTELLPWSHCRSVVSFSYRDLRDSGVVCLTHNCVNKGYGNSGLCNDELRNYFVVRTCTPTNIVHKKWDSQAKKTRTEGVNMRGWEGSFFRNKVSCSEKFLVKMRLDSLRWTTGNVEQLILTKTDTVSSQETYLLFSRRNSFILESHETVKWAASSSNEWNREETRTECKFRRRRDIYPFSSPSLTPTMRPTNETVLSVVMIIGFIREFSRVQMLVIIVKTREKLHNTIMLVMITKFLSPSYILHNHHQRYQKKRNLKVVRWRIPWGSHFTSLPVWLRRPF